MGCEDHCHGICNADPKKKNRINEEELCRSCQMRVDTLMSTYAVMAYIQKTLFDIPGQVQKGFMSLKF